MPLFQCQHCGCVDASNLSEGFTFGLRELYDWTNKEDRRSKRLCCACMPDKFTDGTSTGRGKWHGRFERVFLKLDEWITNEDGNLEHSKTGDTNYLAHQIHAPNPDLPKMRHNRGRRR
ncbi:hypothetical protein F7U66_01495 [Vibrio parahaemolyticus]|nr:hypothetical protein [Vibrio parahaemolyticus]